MSGGLSCIRAHVAAEPRADAWASYGRGTGMDKNNIPLRGFAEGNKQSWLQINFEGIPSYQVCNTVTIKTYWVPTLHLRRYTGDCNSFL